MSFTGSLRGEAFTFTVALLFSASRVSDAYRPEGRASSLLVEWG